MSTARALRLGATIVLAGLCTRGCFDSDQKVVAAPPAESSTGAVTTGGSTSTGFVETSTGEVGERTCRDTLACAAMCVFEGSSEGGTAIDLVFTCLLDCEPDTVPEAVDVFRLIECVTADCIDRGRCDILLPEEGTSSGGESSSSGDSSSTGDSSSSGGSSSSGSGSSDSGSTGGSGSDSGSTGIGTGTGTLGSSSTGDDVDPQQQCTACLLSGLGDPDNLPAGFACLEEALACE